MAQQLMNPTKIRKDAGLHPWLMEVPRLGVESEL